MGALRRLLPGHDHIFAVAAIPGGDAMSPPYLAGDTPVADVFHPIKIRPLPHGGDDPGPSLLHRLEGGFGQRLGPDEPLLGEEGLHHGLAAITVPHAVMVVLNLQEGSVPLEVLDDPFTTLKPLHALVGTGLLGHVPLFVNNLHCLQMMALSDLKVIGVMGRRDLQGPGAELRIDICIGDDRDAPIHHRQDDVAADEILIAFILWVHGNCRITHHGLGAGGDYFDIPPSL